MENINNCDTAFTYVVNVPQHWKVWDTGRVTETCILSSDLSWQKT